MAPHTAGGTRIIDFHRARKDAYTIACNLSFCITYIGVARARRVFARVCVCVRASPAASRNTFARSRAVSLPAVARAPQTPVLVCRIHMLATNAHSGNAIKPTRWLMKNTDTFAGFAHAINSYLAGVALADRHGLALIHRPQIMAHGLGFAFVDFFDSDPRGIVPPVYTATLTSNASAMLVDGHPVQLYVQLATAGNSSLVKRQLTELPNYSMLWLRKGRQAFVDPSLGCHNTSTDEVCYTALWFRERFWRAVLARRRRFGGTVDAEQISGRRHWSRSKSLTTVAASGKREVRLHTKMIGSSRAAARRPPIRIAVHVRRGDVYYLGPKTRLPHPHWVEVSKCPSMADQTRMHVLENAVCLLLPLTSRGAPARISRCADHYRARHACWRAEGACSATR